MSAVGVRDAVMMRNSPKNGSLINNKELNDIIIVKERLFNFKKVTTLD